MYYLPVYTSLQGPLGHTQFPASFSAKMENKHKYKNSCSVIQQAYDRKTCVPAMSEAYRLSLHLKLSENHTVLGAHLIAVTILDHNFSFKNSKLQIHHQESRTKGIPCLLIPNQALNGPASLT